ncbi:hypothetical protein NOVOSPHI9U_80009 [Novosphingobium sp. 9U]|nr:hypothetical protein NOVOSPHI9U_80009 [Novosphingobium sp. 9U]
MKASKSPCASSTARVNCLAERPMTVPMALGVSPAHGLAGVEAVESMVMALQSAVCLSARAPHAPVDGRCRRASRNRPRHGPPLRRDAEPSGIRVR